MESEMKQAEFQALTEAAAAAGDAAPAFDFSTVAAPAALG